jgi:hypothetical protein
MSIHLPLVFYIMTHTVNGTQWYCTIHTVPVHVPVLAVKIKKKSSKNHNSSRSTNKIATAAAITSKAKKD